MGQGIHRNIPSPIRKCKYCGGEFEARQANQAFCKPSHRKYFHNCKLALKMAHRMFEEVRRS
jgi:hypothetical protein